MDAAPILTERSDGMRRHSAKKLTTAAVMASLVFVMTYLLKLPVGYGYVHLGDGAVFLAAMLLGGPGVAAAALGSALSDLLAGFMPYVLPTAAIKAAMAFIVWKLWKPRAWLRTAAAFLLAEVVLVAGYFAVDLALYGAAAAWSAVGANCLQGLTGFALGMLCRALYPRLKQIVK